MNALSRLPSVLAALLILAGLLTGGCARSGGGHGVEVATVREWLSGSFSSAEQAAKDPEYRDIRLHIAPIWNDRADGPWLYVEQATAEAMDKPYRQRVYRLSRTSDNSFRSDVYTLPEPVGAFAGAYKQDEPLTNLSPEQLTLKDGCAVDLTYHQCSKLMDGGTKGNGCASELRGASYATSEVILWEDLLISWDRGYDAAGKQVWGAEKGGYRFKKISRNPRVEESATGTAGGMDMTK